MGGPSVLGGIASDPGVLEENVENPENAEDMAADEPGPNPMRFYGLDGEPITALTAYRLLHRPAERRIGFDAAPPCRVCGSVVTVSTYATIRPVQDGTGWALYEAFVERGRPGSRSVLVARYRSRGEALAGHHRAFELAGSHPHLVSRPG